MKTQKFSTVDKAFFAGVLILLILAIDMFVNGNESIVAKGFHLMFDLVFLVVGSISDINIMR